MSRQEHRSGPGPQARYQWSLSDSKTVTSITSIGTNEASLSLTVKMCSLMTQESTSIKTMIGRSSARFATISCKEIKKVGYAKSYKIGLPGSKPGTEPLNEKSNV